MGQPLTTFNLFIGHTYLGCGSWTKKFSKYKFMTGIAEGIWCLFLTKAKDSKPLFTQSHCEPSKIRVTRNQTKAIELSCIEQIHCINNQGAVRGIFTGRICELLDRFYGILL